MPTAVATRVCDWSRSHLHFRLDTRRTAPLTVSHQLPFTLNHVRVPLECRLTIAPKDGSAPRDYLMTANCKTERVHVPRDIWTQPNADVIFIAGGEQFLILKTFDHCDRTVKLHPPELGDQPKRQVIDPREAFTELHIDMQWNEGRVLSSNQQIIDAIQQNHPLTSRTTIENDRYSATLEYPIKTVNCSEVDGYYQTDTGPILFPDLDREPDDLIHGLGLAFVAHSSPDWAEFIVRQPTDTRDGVQVEHFARSVRLENIVNEVVQV